MYAVGLTAIFALYISFIVDPFSSLYIRWIWLTTITKENARAYSYPHIYSFHQTHWHFQTELFRCLYVCICSIRKRSYVSIYTLQKPRKYSQRNSHIEASDILRRPSSIRMMCSRKIHQMVPTKNNVWTILSDTKQ